MAVAAAGHSPRRATPGAWARYVIPIRTYSTLNRREHWAARHRRMAAERAAVARVMPRQAVDVTAAVWLVRIAPRRLDDDNLAGALKAIRDGVAGRLGVDDADPGVVWRYAQRRGRPREYAVVVELGAEIPPESKARIKS